MTEDNEIIAEIRQIREALLAEYNGDLEALVKGIQRRTEAAREVRSIPRPEPEDLNRPAKRAV